MAPEARTSEQLQQEMTRHVVRFAEKRPDWDAFNNTDVNRRAQFRYVGAGGAKPDRWALADFVPPRSFTLTVMYVPPGGGGTMHGHREEEVFFVLDGQLTVTWEKDGERCDVGLGPRDMIFNPPGSFHQFQNYGVEGVHLLVMLGAPKPGPTYYP